MTYYCKFCEKSKMSQSKINHLKSLTHRKLNESIKNRYNLFNPIIIENDEILKEYTEIYNSKYQQFSVSCVIKLLTSTNHVRHIRIDEKLNLYFFSISKKTYVVWK